MMSGFVTVCFLKKIICPLLKLCYSYIEKKKKNRMCFPDSIVDLHSVQYIVLVRVSNHSYTVTLFFFFFTSWISNTGYTERSYDLYGKY